ncbi:transglutaminase TgpA family protein [Neobacillus soli]|uniref:transglutaminase TgpA family protein n=1 Tax=Neobacillus soli TaxID=220688 RepID=UPI000824AFF9|nr:transglutaminaseTgpA domain-containing protein [Neobacillus soli]
MRKRDLPSLFLYTFGFFLLWEWLRPIEQLTETDNIEMFIFFLLLSFAISFFHMKWPWQLIIKLVFILYSVNRLYYQEGFFQFRWLKAFITDGADNIVLLAGRHWNDLSNEFRTLLFFILLWLMVYLIHYWLLNRQRIFIFFLMTLIYISVLDTFTPYSAKAAIVRTIIAGFAVMGMLTFYRMTRKEKVNCDSSFLRRWMVPLAGMIVFSVLVGIAAPKAAPIWPDPVPFFTANNNKEGAEGNKAGPHKIGYGTDDTALGGPFIGDDSPVFAYEANGKNYWKMETKDTYTGKGWLASGSTLISYREEEFVPVTSYPETVETIKESARVIVHGKYKYNYIMYPAGIKMISAMEPSDPDGNRFVVDANNERISFFNNDQNPVVPRAFTAVYEIPKYKAADLKQTASFDSEKSVKDHFFYMQYTQLPDQLPDRVKVLAEEITAGKTSWFEKAKAVEGYFGKSDYTYDQKNVAVPDTNDDYVDQFLFETKHGYCDNFSSSMVVMLRSLGIPTRWVKGFTGGDFQEYSQDDTSKRYYQVTNNNAHSWVEVYFPNQGWVPFEPTKGFTNGAIINYQTDAVPASTNPQSTPPPVKKPQHVEKDVLKTPEDAKKSFDVKNILNKAKLTLKNNWKLIFLVLVLLTGITATLYRIRGKWVPYCVLLLYRFKKKDENIGAAYLILLNQFERYGINRKENQTLRNYARYIDTFYSTRDMTRLTAYYEQYMYHQSLPKGTWKESRELWENLIKKTIT